MIIVLKPDVPPDAPEVQRLVRDAESGGVTTQLHVVQGALRSVTELYLLGPTAAIPDGRFETYDCVEKVVRVRERYRVIGRHGELDATGFEYNGVTLSQENLQLFPGVCAIDTRENLARTFAALERLGIRTTRAGAYKPRTSPYDFQGHGAACLPWLFELAGRHGIRVVAMEVTHEAHVEEIARALEDAGRPTGVMLQIGTRNAQNFELLKAVGQQPEFPVLCKRGMGITLDESLNACEYLAAGGNRRIIFCLRGVKTHLAEPHRNLVDFAQVPLVKRLTRLPVCIDPSHALGRRSVAPDGLLELFHVTAQGVIAGANMVLVDVHPEPTTALCDGPQALLLEELPDLLADVAIARRAYEARRARATSALTQAGD